MMYSEYITPFMNITLFNCISVYLLPSLREEILLSLTLTLIITYKRYIDYYFLHISLYEMMNNKINTCLYFLSSVVTYNIYQQIQSDYYSINMFKYVYVYLSAHHYLSFLFRLTILLTSVASTYLSQHYNTFERIHAILLLSLRLISRGINEGRTIDFNISTFEVTIEGPRHQTHLTIDELNTIAPLTSLGINPAGKQQCFNNDNCNICLDVLTDKQLCRVLPCKHIFHTSCVDEWILKSSPTCPICKKNLK